MIGVMLGLEVYMSPFVVNVTFTTAVVCFAIAFGYRNLIVAKHRVQSHRHGDAMLGGAWALLDPKFEFRNLFVYKIFGRFFPYALTGFACVFGLIGGILTSKLGSGADMLAYIFGIFIWNACVPEGAEMSTNMLTASSVLIMAVCSIFGTFLRELNAGGICAEVKLCWAACIPVVVLGAPLGSLLLTPALTEVLQICFYVLCAVQLASFGILKIKGNVFAWIIVILVIVLMSSSLLLHFLLVVRSETRKGGRDKVATNDGRFADPRANHPHKDIPSKRSEELSRAEVGA